MLWRVGAPSGGGGLESRRLARARVVVAPFVSLPLAPATEFNRRGQKIPNKSPDGLLTGDRTGAEGSAYLVSPISYGRTTRSASNKA